MEAVRVSSSDAAGEELTLFIFAPACLEHTRRRPLVPLAAFLMISNRNPKKKSNSLLSRTMSIGKRRNGSGDSNRVQSRIFFLSFLLPLFFVVVFVVVISIIATNEISLACWCGGLLRCCAARCNGTVVVWRGEM